MRLRDRLAIARVATEEASTRTQGKSADVDIGGTITKGKSRGVEAEEQSDEPIAVTEKECEASTVNVLVTGVRRRAKAMCTSVSSDAAGACAEDTTEEPVKKKRATANASQVTLTMSGGRTMAARRRKRRREADLAAVQNILTSELRERREERAKVLRLAVRQALDVLPKAERVVRRGEHVRALRVAVATVKETEGRSVKKKNGQRRRQSRPATPRRRSPMPTGWRVCSATRRCARRSCQRKER